MKKSNSNLILLNVFFVVCLIIANVVTAKVIDTGILFMGDHIFIPGAALTYAFTFLCTDIVGELWGKKEANKTVLRGFYAQFFALVLIYITKYFPAANSEVQAAYDTLLGQTPIFVVGSVIAYLLSQSWDVWIFHKVRAKLEAKPSMRWIWNNVSTMTSQVIDTAIFITIAFGIGFGWLFEEGGIIRLVGMIIGQYVLKFLLAILDTPFFYLFTHKKD